MIHQDEDGTQQSLSTLYPPPPTTTTMYHPNKHRPPYHAYNQISHKSHINRGDKVHTQQQGGKEEEEKKEKDSQNQNIYALGPTMHYPPHFLPPPHPFGFLPIPLPPHSLRHGVPAASTTKTSTTDPHHHFPMPPHVPTHAFPFPYPPLHIKRGYSSAPPVPVSIQRPPLPFSHRTIQSHPNPNTCIPKNGNNLSKELEPVCTCKNSQCLKLYCKCFANNRNCGNLCKCIDCKNDGSDSNREARDKAKEMVLARNPQAFASLNSRVKQQKQQQQQQEQPLKDKKLKKGCKCRKSFCLKKYCECFNAGIKCGSECKCYNCHNLPLAQFIYKKKDPTTTTAANISHDELKTGKVESLMDVSNFPPQAAAAFRGVSLEEYEERVAKEKKDRVVAAAATKKRKVGIIKKQQQKIEVEDGVDVEMSAETLTTKRSNIIKKKKKSRISGRSSTICTNVNINIDPLTSNNNKNCYSSSDGILAEQPLALRKAVTLANAYHYQRNHDISLSVSSPDAPDPAAVESSIRILAGDNVYRSVVKGVNGGVKNKDKGSVNALLLAAMAMGSDRAMRKERQKLQQQENVGVNSQIKLKKKKGRGKDRRVLAPSNVGNIFKVPEWMSPDRKSMVESLSWLKRGKCHMNMKSMDVLSTACANIAAGSQI